jgi:hypothetical protein
VHAKRRLRRVVTFREPKGRSSSTDWSKLILAPAELELVAQYETLRAQIKGDVTLANAEDLDAKVSHLQIEILRCVQDDAFSPITSTTSRTRTDRHLCW